MLQQLLPHAPHFAPLASRLPTQNSPSPPQQLCHLIGRWWPALISAGHHAALPVGRQGPPAVHCGLHETPQTCPPISSLPMHVQSASPSGTPHHSASLSGSAPSVQDAAVKHQQPGSLLRFESQCCELSLLSDPRAAACFLGSVDPPGSVQHWAQAASKAFLRISSVVDQERPSRRPSPLHFGRHAPPAPQCPPRRQLQRLQVMAALRLPGASRSRRRSPDLEDGPSDCSPSWLRHQCARLQPRAPR
mmetsp:Transcript_130608/g.227074  ORF Transcript_130608/g.227074 Transcript_130608/m.227074 type:complete len:247 (-) Transcript_130608:1588-2328(-)